MGSRRILAGLLFAFACASGLAAQGPPDFGLPSGSTSRNIGRVIVRVRERGGAKISSLALVRIYSDASIFEATSGSLDNYLFTFDNVPLGEYHIEVRAPGYQRGESDASLMTPNGVAHVWVDMRPESSAGSAPADNARSGAPVMAPKAHKEFEQAAAALRANDLKKAQEFLDRAMKLAPGNPDVHYVQGIIYLQQQNVAAARASLQTAVNLFPRHGEAQAVLGVTLYRLGEFAAAAAALQIAVEVSPQNWQSHRALALSFFQLREFEKARAHVERALEIAGENAPELRVLLARVWLALGKRDKALAELQSFVAAHPALPETPEAQRLLASLQQAKEAARLAAEQPPPASNGASANSMAPAVSIDPAMLETRSALRRWAPLSVDDTTPELVENASCHLPDVLAGAARRAVALAENLERVAALEKVEEVELNEEGEQLRVRSGLFDYSVSIIETRPGNLSVEESRKLQSKSDSLKDTATKGLGAMALIFHPYYVRDFEMRCEGLTETQGQPAWSVYFKQRADKPSRVFRYSVQATSYEVPIKGRAWIAANNFQVLRLETDLVAPLRKLRLEVDHISIEYQPVEFKSRKIRLWLPASAEMHSLIRGRRSNQHHSFSDYMVFAVDVNHKITELPKP